MFNKKCLFSDELNFVTTIIKNSNISVKEFCDFIIKNKVEL